MSRLFLLTFVIIGTNAVLAQPDVKGWTRLAGTGSYDEGYAVAADPLGNCIVVGETLGGLFPSYYGKRDLFVAKYDKTGNLLWGKQRGTGERDCAFGVTTDSSGNIYATGFTAAALDGQSYAGNWDVFLMKLSAAGDWLWTRQIGTGQDDEGYAVTTDAGGNVYITGYVRGNMHGQTRVGSADVFVCKYNSAGNRLWTRLFGSVEIDQAWAIACDAGGNVFVTGYCLGSIEGIPYHANGDLFLAKYDTDGNRLWLRQWGTVNAEHGYSLAPDAAGNVYLSGYTSGELYGPKSGQRDIFLAKLDPSGNRIWARQLGTDGHDQGWGVAVAADGNIYLAGETGGPLVENMHQGGLDVFLAKYDPSGNRQWMTQVGSAVDDWARGGIAVAAAGVSYLGGVTRGNLDGVTGSGLTDAFAMKFGPPLPPPDLVADAGASVYLLRGRSARLEGTATGGTPPYVFAWLPAEGLDNPQLPRPTASPAATVTYTLTVTDAANAQARDSVLVVVSGSSVPADLDGDNDVDQADFGLFQACLTGSDVAQDEQGCLGARLDADGDVDADDLTLFVGCLSGPDVPGNPGCAGSFSPVGQ